MTNEQRAEIRARCELAVRLLNERGLSLSLIDVYTAISDIPSLLDSLDKMEQRIQENVNQIEYTIAERDEERNQKEVLFCKTCELEADANQWTARAEALERALRKAVRAGLLKCFGCANVGKACGYFNPLLAGHESCEHWRFDQVRFSVGEVQP